MIAKVYSAIPDGYHGNIVEVEGDSNQGLPSFGIVGMANKTIFEARERVRSAIANSGLSFPQRKVTINLAPAELAKDGTHLDLPIALAVLVLSQQLLQSDLENRLFIGELSLNGSTKPVRGIINAVETAKTKGYQEIYLPHENLPTATLIDGIKIYGVKNLNELFLHLKNIKLIAPSMNNKFYTQSPTAPDTASVVKNTQSLPNTNPINVVKNTQPPIGISSSNVVKNNLSDKTSEPNFDSIYGQKHAKRALTIALAGKHNILFTGPPGSGKTLLAHASRYLLPLPTPPEVLEITKLHNLTSTNSQILHQCPFRTPHHSASPAAIIGGGNPIKPGEISLAHRGILFLDELPEYPRNILEALRQPLEDKTILISRASHQATYPADFILIATMNPCPCGHFGDTKHPCTCSLTQVQNYRNRLSGPILDRIDLIVEVNAVDSNDILPPSTSQSSVVKNNYTDINTISEHQAAQNSILKARHIQSNRYRNQPYYNGTIPTSLLTKHIALDECTKILLKKAITKFNLSTRSYFKVLKVARTIADLEQSTQIRPQHVSEALSYRKRSP